MSRSLRSFLLSGLIALLFELFAPPQAVRAHPADVYLQATYITVSPTQIVLELDLAPGVLVAPEVIPQIDTDGDEQISEMEKQAYADTILQHLELQVDEKSLSISVTQIDMPEYLILQSGYGVIRIFTISKLVDSMAGMHRLYYKNSYSPTSSVYAVNAFVKKEIPITLGKQNRDSIQQSMTMEYTIGSAATEVANVDTPVMTPTNASEQSRQLLGYLSEPVLSPWALLLALAFAVALGGLHALTPGHGKTLVAAYLVGSRGTVRHAVLLGGIVTFTHTASVIVIGLLALFASQFIVPDVLVPVLDILSGLLVALLGLRLVWQRWSAFHNSRSPDHDHLHDHGHMHNHSHNHESHTHDHGDGHIHSHFPPAEGIKLGNLVAMGVSGGLVPCPEALGIMVIAIGLNRILLGLGLIVSFSFGLAAVLIVIGILLVRSRSLVERFGSIGSRWSSALPLVSAVIVTVLGIGITLSGLATYLR